MSSEREWITIREIEDELLAELSKPAAEQDHEKAKQLAKMLVEEAFLQDGFE